MDEQIDLKHFIFGVFTQHQWKDDRSSGNFFTKSVCLCHCEHLRLIHTLLEVTDTKHMTHVCILTAHAFRSNHCKLANIYSQLACFSFCRIRSTWVCFWSTTQSYMCTHNWKVNGEHEHPSENHLKFLSLSCVTVSLKTSLLSRGEVSCAQITNWYECMSDMWTSISMIYYFHRNIDVTKWLSPSHFAHFHKKF